MTGSPTPHPVDATPPAPPAPQGKPPLAGVRILDMATVLAAPFGATLCADWGADVLKLELPDGSDPLRHLLPVHDGLPLFWKVVIAGRKASRSTSASRRAANCS